MCRGVRGGLFACASTALEQSPWLRIDLGRPLDVAYINVYAPEQSGIQFRVGRNTTKVTSSMYLSMHPTGMMAPLTLCEVENLIRDIQQLQELWKESDIPYRIYKLEAMQLRHWVSQSSLSLPPFPYLSRSLPYTSLALAHSESFTNMDISFQGHWNDKYTNSEQEKLGWYERVPPEPPLDLTGWSPRGDRIVGQLFVVHDLTDDP